MNNSYCCLSTGQRARCLLLQNGIPCEGNDLEPDVRLFSSTTENNRQACEIQRVTGTCTGTPTSSSSSAQSSAGCGNNFLEASAGEECDWGGNNSDTLPNRCRTNCTFPVCGDGKVDDSFSDPVSGTMIAEECDPGADADCNSDCTVNQIVNPLFFMFPKSIESPLYIVRNIFDWNSIFFPLSTISF
jgi:hypothetical protein